MNRKKRKRAKAILDFERNDDDELGFRTNDIITIISQKVSQTQNRDHTCIASILLCAYHR